MTKNVPKAGSQLYFTVIAADKAGNRGKPAMPLSISFVEPEFAQTEGKKSDSSSDLSGGAIAGIVLAVLILVAILAAILGMKRYRICFN